MVGLFLTLAAAATAYLRPAAHLAPRAVGLRARPTRLPQPIPAAAGPAGEALAAAAELLAAGEGSKAAEALAWRAGDLVACDAKTLDALCGDDGDLRSLALAVLEAVADEAKTLERSRRDLLKRLIEAAREGGPALDVAVEASAEAFVDTAFVDFLEAEEARVRAAEGGGSPQLLNLLGALKARAAVEIEEQVFGAGALALRAILGVPDAAARGRAFGKFLRDADDGGAEVVAALHDAQADLRARAEESGIEDTNLIGALGAIDALARVAADAGR